MLYQINEETKHKVKQFYITVHEDRYQMHLTATKCGVDWNVVLLSGEGHHVGAVALGVPGYIDNDRARPTVSVSSLCINGHRDDELARLIATELAQKLEATVVVTVGLHGRKDTAEEMGSLCNTAMICCRKFIEQVSITDWGMKRRDI